MQDGAPKLPRAHQRPWAAVIGVLVVALVSAAVIGWRLFRRIPRAEIDHIQVARYDTFWQTGYVVSFDVKNAGGAGPITIVPRLTTSEGEWQREQTILFKAGETRPFRFDFSEPSASASNVTCDVTVFHRPESDDKATEAKTIRECPD